MLLWKDGVLGSLPTESIESVKRTNAQLKSGNVSSISYCNDQSFAVGSSLSVLDGTMSALLLVSVPGKNQKQKLVFCWDRKQPAGHCEQLRLLRCNRLEDSHSGCEKTSGR